MYFLKATLSKLTTEYAMMLSGIVKNISETFKFNNFDMAYIDLPVTQSKSNIILALYTEYTSIIFNYTDTEVILYNFGSPVC